MPESTAANHDTSNIEKHSPEKKNKTGKLQKTKVSYHRRPDDLHLDLWQFGLRKQFGEENQFHITNTGSHPFISEFVVWNPSSKNSYTVNIRTGYPKKGLPAENTFTTLANACNCQDFKTNRLGICKHISAVLHAIGKKRGAKKALAAAARPQYSLVYVDYRNAPRVRLTVGV